MPIKLSGPLTMQDIIDEFGGQAPHSLSEYYRGGNRVPNKNVNDAIPLEGSDSPISYEDFYGATKIITMTITAYGGGGAGGSGFENNSTDNTRGDTGEWSGIMTKATYDSKTDLSTAASDWFIPTTSGGIDSRAGAVGGLGGQSGVFTTANATAGEASDFGAGGAAGPRNNAGGNAPWGHWGAGGGGGGGDQGNGDNYDFFGLINRGGSDEWGKAGAGGEAGPTSVFTCDVDVEVDYVVRLGGGGYPATAIGNHDGGAGAPGYLKFTIDTVANQTFEFKPPSSGSSLSAYTQERHFGFRIKRNGSVELYNI
jgi:hypothetical protein